MTRNEGLSLPSNRRSYFIPRKRDMGEEATLRVAKRAIEQIGFFLQVLFLSLSNRHTHTLTETEALQQFFFYAIASGSEHRPMLDVAYIQLHDLTFSNHQSLFLDQQNKKILP